MVISYDVDQRIEYLSDMIQGMVKDHEISYHKNLESFDESLFIDNVQYKEYSIDQNDEHEPIVDDEHNYKFTNALNKLNSFNTVSYCFYEIFKPIGGTNEKYIKIKLFTDGTLDIQAVVGLSDCTHVPWVYGKQEYLRSLNTGNQKYEFKLTLPFNDFNSILWWKPDEKEELEQEDDNEVKSSDVKYRYYKPYEIERFLRWFGTNHIPLLDLDSIQKKTICSIPQLSNDIQSSKFYKDATHILNPDLSKATIDTTTSMSLLTLAPKSTIDIDDREDGQYAVFVVSGNQQTSNISFHIKGKIRTREILYNEDGELISNHPFIQEMNHYSRTIERINNLYVELEKSIQYLELVKYSDPSKDITIPKYWYELQSTISKIATEPTFIDLIRMRQIDLDLIDIGSELKQIFNPDDDDVDVNIKIMYEYIFNDDTEQNKYELYESLNLPTTVKMNLKTKLEQLSDNINQFELECQPSVDELRDRIITFNNLIVRLPIDTYTNKTTSLHIFQDWKNFVDNSLEYLCDNQMLFRGEQMIEFGTDGIQHSFYEYYTHPDKKPGQELIDYSYRFELNENGERTGKVIHDRFDFWSDEDFI